ncbi:hypothetical protein QYF36_024798 [Acer negundo]|nr:hypothetical protein QYF36_024798 [Acer negundo]
MLGHIQPNHCWGEKEENVFSWEFHLESLNAKVQRTEQNREQNPLCSFRLQSLSLSSPLILISKLTQSLTPDTHTEPCGVKEH